MNARFLILVLILASLIGTGFYIFSNRSISGTYISQTPNSVHMIRLVETGDGKLSGQIENVLLTDTGNIDDISATVEGATDHKNLNLTIQSTLIPITVTASGTREGSNIVLTFGILGAPPKTRTYTSSNLQAFEIYSASLRDKSQKILAEKAATEAHDKALQREHEFEGNVNTLVSRMQRAGSKIDELEKSFPGIEQKYQNITVQLNSYYDKARSQHGNTVAIGQIEVAMNQGHVASDQIHYRVMSLSNDFNGKLADMGKSFFTYKQQCRNAGSAAQDVQDDNTASCTKLLEAGKTFQPKAKSMLNELSHLEQTYKSEYQKQLDIIMAVQQLH